MAEEKKRFDKSWITAIILFLLAIISFLVFPIYVSLGLFVIIYLPIILYILIYKWIKLWFASVVFSFSIWLNILILIIPVFLGIAALDLSHMYTEFQTNPKYIAIDNNGLTFATEMKSLDINLESIAAGDSFRALDKKELSQLQKEIDSEVKDKIIFVIDKEVFKGVQEINIADLEVVLTKNQALELLESENPQLPDKTGLISQFPKERLKSMVLLLLLQEKLKKDGADSLISALKEDKIKIYPERFSIKLLIKVIPASILLDTGLIPDLTLSSRELAEEATNNT